MGRETSITPETLEALRAISTPSVCNAIEKSNLRPRTEGFVNDDVRPFFPELGPLVGFAVTARASATCAPTPEQHELRYQLLRLLQQAPGPTVLVIEDIDQPGCLGAFWGEVQANIHKRLGCIGTITNGGVRDLEEVRSIGFHLFARRAIPSHAYVHLVDVASPVTVGGLVIETGDLIHGDRHGIASIPLEIAAGIPQSVAAIEKKELAIISYCQEPEFDIAQLRSIQER